MNQNNSANHWQNNPQLKNIPSERIQMLAQMAEQLDRCPQSQKPALFLSLIKNSSSAEPAFTQTERDLLISILTENMSADEKAKVHMIQKFASQHLD